MAESCDGFTQDMVSGLVDELRRFVTEGHIAPAEESTAVSVPFGARRMHAARHQPPETGCNRWFSYKVDNEPCTCTVRYGHV